MGNQFYAEEKFRMAVFLMATGRGKLRERLNVAFCEFQSVSIADLPENLREDYEWIKESLTNKPAKQRALVQGKLVEEWEGRIGATLAHMRYKKAEEIARRICELADKLSHANQSIQ